jgi:EAL domain-containing protein (putative c-di-GMP-specific phosphodiesterase class I)
MIMATHTTSRPAPRSSTRLSMIDGVGSAADRRRMERELRAATAAGAFVLHYQPRLSLATGAIEANEALIRWPDRKRGLIPPNSFIPVAEQSDLINLIGAWVLLEACTEAVGWECHRLSVNVSGRQLQSGVLPIQLAMALERSGLPPDRLELELTESMLVDGSTDTLLALSAIRDLGIGLALDDFGTGFASLSMLKRLPLTVMKLDRSLVRELPFNREDAAIVRAVIETAHAMRLTVVAEGIETEAQRAFLSGIGCDEGQGYLFSHPLPAEQLRSKLGITLS